MAPSIAATVFGFNVFGSNVFGSNVFGFLSPSPIQALIVGLVVLLLFGNRLPSVMRSLGEGITEFKKGLKGGESDPNANIEDQRDTNS